MNANKQLLNRTGQVGILVLVGAMTMSVFIGGLYAFVALLSGILGFYLLTHQEFSLKKPSPPGGPER